MSSIAKQRFFSFRKFQAGYLAPSPITTKTVKVLDDTRRMSPLQKQASEEAERKPGLEGEPAWLPRPRSGRHTRDQGQRSRPVLTHARAQGHLAGM